MPAEFEKMRKEILANLKKQNPSLSDKELESRSYAIATTQWKKTHGGKGPNEKAKLNLIEYYAPIKEFANVDNEFKIRGVAISETTTSNNHKFISEELRKSASTLNGVPLLVDHSNTIESIKGKVLSGTFDEANKHVTFEAKVMDDKIKQMIEDGRINSVSIGATVENLEENDKGELVAKGITFKELSLVAVPADSNATFARAMYEMFMRQKEETDGEEEADFETEKEEKVTIKMKCKECGFIGKPNNEGFCPECGGKMNEMKEEKESNDMIIQLKGGSKMAETSDSKEMTEMEAIKQELENAKKALSEYHAKERAELENSYAKLCAEKGVNALDVKAFSDEVIKTLISQVSSILVKAKAEEKAEIMVETQDEKAEFLIESGNGSIHGGSFTVIRNKY